MKKFVLGAALMAAASSGQAAISVGSYVFENNAFVDVVTSFSGTGMYDGTSYANPLDAQLPVTDINVSTFYATAPSPGYDNVTLGLGFDDNGAYNGSEADAAFVFLWDQTGNGINVTINGVSQSVSPETLYGCGSPSTQCVADGVAWNGNTLNNQYLGIALVDFSDFGLAFGDALPGDIELQMIQNSSTVPVAFSLGGVFYTTPVPVPAAVWLFGSGLLGLVGVARRRRV